MGMLTRAPLVLSLQGCMAVGKTTAARYVQSRMPQVHVCPEDNLAVIGEVKRRGLDKNAYADYLEIQRLFLQSEVRRYEAASRFPCALMDFGAEEIAFYTLHYPQIIGQDWAVEAPLSDALADVRRCMPARILFLDAPDDVLRARRDGDASRARGFFDTYLTRLLPLKRRWFIGRPDVDVLNTGEMDAQAVGEAVCAWVERCMDGRECGGHMTDIQDKLAVLARIARTMTAGGVRWAVGGSLMLYLRGAVSGVHDIDLMVAEADAPRADALLAAMGERLPEKSNEGFGTKFFRQYRIGGVDVDMMGGMEILSGGRAHSFPLLEEEITARADVLGETVPLHSVRVWQACYALMGRSEKAELTARWLKEHPQE